MLSCKLSPYLKKDKVAPYYPRQEFCQQIAYSALISAIPKIFCVLVILMGTTSIFKYNVATPPSNKGSLLSLRSTILVKSPGTLCKFTSSHNIHPPFPPTQCWFLGEVHAVTEKVFFTITPCISGTDQHCFWGGRGVRGSYNT